MFRVRVCAIQYDHCIILFATSCVPLLSPRICCFHSGFPDDTTFSQGLTRSYVQFGCCHELALILIRSRYLRLIDAARSCLAQSSRETDSYCEDSSSNDLRSVVACSVGQVDPYLNCCEQPRRDAGGNESQQRTHLALLTTVGNRIPMVDPIPRSHSVHMAPTQPQFPSRRPPSATVYNASSMPTSKRRLDSSPP